MSEAPERIWAWQGPRPLYRREWGVKLSTASPDLAMTPYIRADLIPQWQPIETAPKDGADIVLRRKGRKPCVCSWWRHPGGNGYWMGWRPGPDPTHWMPFPELPEAQTENDIPRTSVSAAPHLAENNVKTST